MGMPARFVIEYEESTPEILIIRDVGHEIGSMTVTNDAKGVVEYLRAKNLLPDGRRLAYYDSEGSLDEILIAYGRFNGFKPGAQKINGKEKEN